MASTAWLPTGPEQTAELICDFAANGILAEDEAGRRRYDQQQRSQRKDGIIGERRSQARDAVARPSFDSRGKHMPHGRSLVPRAATREWPLRSCDNPNLRPPARPPTLSLRI